MPLILTLLPILLAQTPDQEGVALYSPGLAPSQVDAQGRLIEDWGTLSLELVGEGLGAPSALKVAALELDGVIPAARITWRDGSLSVSAVVFRAPVFPAGLDLLSLRLEQQSDAGRSPGCLRVNLPEGTRETERSVSLGSRRVLILPDQPRAQQQLRAWGHFDEASSLPGWAQPRPGFDPAFANIRAGMGGVPILYRFQVEPRSVRGVVLGFCESYWSEAGSRVLSCKVEGDPAEVVDPLRLWGRHRPGGLGFEGSDANGDGLLEVLVLPGPGTPDRNPILNAIWIFEPELEVDPAQVITGRMNAAAERYVDVGGDRDQPIRPGGRLEFPFVLESGEAREFTFLVACRGTSLPAPDESTWTPRRLRAAAREVWEDWPGE